MRAAGYIRVSSGSQVEGRSLGAQERLFRELCKSKGWDPIIIYRDEGKSAKSDSIKKRPAFKQLLDDARKGLFDIVVVHTFDRWARNLRIGLEGLKILGENNTGFVSIAEQIDTSNPAGRFQLNILGIHIKKGQEERALQGRHTGGIPFGYESCYAKEDGVRRPICHPEHPGGLHVHLKEGPIVAEMFKRYATGATSTSELAMWLNVLGFRTRNMHSLKGPDGVLRPAEPRLFTNASVRVILHNSFYCGLIRHRGKQLPGTHDPFVSKELFDQVQVMMKKNSGRSSTLRARPKRQYLLKGIIRCAYCGMPMWAQTYNSGGRYYREHRASRGHDNCAAKGGSIPCRIADEQIGRLIEAIELRPDWHEEVLARISLQDEAERIANDRKRVQERLRRLGKAYVDGFYSDDDYKHEKHSLEMQLETLVLPEADAAREAGELLMKLPEMWGSANLDERRKLLLTMLDVVYVDTKEDKAIVAIQPKAPFRPVFDVATTREGSGVMLINQPPELDPKDDLCSWWRRGREPVSEIQDSRLDCRERVTPYALSGGARQSEKAVAEAGAEGMGGRCCRLVEVASLKDEPHSPQRPQIESRGKQVELHPYIGEAP